jgi:hypothetical protein
MNENEMPSEIATVDPLHEMSDRELMLYIAQSHREILTVIADLKDQVMPMVENLASSPLLRPFLGGK